MPGVLETDGYKFSMAEAGFPLRTETFYYSHRKGGPHYLPFDVEEEIRKLLPGPCRGRAFREDVEFLDGTYPMGGAFFTALQEGQITIKALPKGTWFFDREPVFTVTGPSALVSWLEPLALQFHYRIQIATLAFTDPQRLAEVVKTVTSDEQKRIILETLDAIHFKSKVEITVDTASYTEHVQSRVRRLIEAVGDPTRIFEVGMRSVACPLQHFAALSAAKEAGLQATSNVYLAKQLGLTPVGTMGHEHVQRFGSDAAAFRAMRDRVAGPTSFLLDTFSTIDSGLPEAFALIAEDPSRRDFVRFDSGDKRTQFIYAVMKARGMGIRPRFILEDSFNQEMTEEFETLRKMLEVPAEDVLYGYGGYIVKAPNDPLTRDRVAAVYKLTQSGPTPTMKFGDEPGAGKESIPGQPVLYRPRLGSAEYQGPTGIVAQEGEEMSRDFERLSGADRIPSHVHFTAREAQSFAARKPGLALSPATQTLVQNLRLSRMHSINTRRQ